MYYDTAVIPPLHPHLIACIHTLMPECDQVPVIYVLNQPGVMQTLEKLSLLNWLELLISQNSLSLFFLPLKTFKGFFWFVVFCLFVFSPKFCWNRTFAASLKIQHKRPLERHYQYHRKGGFWLTPAFTQLLTSCGFINLPPLKKTETAENERIAF